MLFGIRKRWFHALSGRCEGYFQPQLRRLDSFDNSLDFYEDGDTTEINYTKAAVGVIHIGVVGR